MTRFAVTLLAAGLLAAIPAAASEPPPGQYQGDFSAEGSVRPVRVTLQLQARKAPADPAGSIRFNEPWVCGFGLQLSSSDAGASIYSFTGAGAGRCVALESGFMRARLARDVKDNTAAADAAPGALLLEVYDRQERPRQTLIVAPQQQRD